ncbi:MAG: helix-turn-helix domain-containing protein, partial [Chloroflexia bacterium]
MDARKETSAFSQWLGQHRRSIDLTQQDLARLVGYSLETIKKIEEGKRRPSRQIAERLAQSLDIPPEEHPLFVRFARNEISAEAPPPLTRGSNQSPWRQLRSPNNLPAQPTAFIGRGEVVSHVASYLLRPAIRLLTLTGPPGIGKTRLSLEVARQTLSDFADGTFFVALAPVLDADLVAATISQTLGIQQLSNQPVMERLKSYLQEKRMLVVIDNFEHVLEAAPLVAALLSAAPGLKVLSTSRTLLHIYGEYSFQVPPMTMPDTFQQLSVTQLAEYESVALFSERALAAKSDFAVTDDNVAVVVGICAGLDGLPLALELAAARTSSLPLETILAQLTSRLDLLVDGPQDMTARQQTLRSAVAWSYDLLNSEEQILFRRMSVFMGSCSIEAAEAVCNADGKLDTATSQLLRSFVNMSLLQNRASASGDIRYAMLETIRQYAAEVLEGAGGNEAQSTHERHALYFVGLAEQAEWELRGPRQIAWFKLLEEEHDNIRAALKWLLEHMHTDKAGKLGAALWRFWYLYGHASEGRQWLEATLQKDATDGAALEASVRADVLNAV